MRCDFYGKCYANRNYVTGGYAEEAHYVGNYSRGNPYFNNDNVGWKDHLNFKWSNNQSLNVSRWVPQVPQVRPNPPEEKPYQLEEFMAQFMKMIQSNFESMSKNHEASIKNIEMKIG